MIILALAICIAGYSNQSGGNGGSASDADTQRRQAVRQSLKKLEQDLDAIEKNIRAFEKQNDEQE